MGQKVNPNGFRFAVRRNWDSRWYAEKKDFPGLLSEDYTIRSLLRKKLRFAAVSRIFSWALRFAVAHFSVPSLLSAGPPSLSPP